uniref:Secreted protein n=1 Tax=Anguilla anguilla TaxID=7936 RepID=A0A0E9TTM2_ANGAN
MPCPNIPNANTALMYLAKVMCCHIMCILLSHDCAETCGQSKPEIQRDSDSLSPSTPDNKHLQWGEGIT